MPLPDMHGRTHCASGSDPIPPECLTASTPWIAVYDNLYYGQTISTTGTGTNLEFPYIDWSTDASGIFTYVRSASTIGATNNYNPRLLVDGVYAFSWDEHSDSVGNDINAVEYFLPVGTYPGGTADNRWKYFMDATTIDNHFRAMGTLILPVDVGSGITIYPYIDVQKESGDPAFDIVFRNKLWIYYLGQLNNTSTFNSSHHGDPYPATP